MNDRKELDKRLKLLETERGKELLKDFIKVVTDEGLISEDLEGEEKEYIQILKADYERKIQKIDDDANKAQLKLF